MGIVCLNFASVLGNMFPPSEVSPLFLKTYWFLRWSSSFSRPLLFLRKSALHVLSAILSKGNFWVFPSTLSHFSISHTIPVYYIERWWLFGGLCTQSLSSIHSDSSSILAKQNEGQLLTCNLHSSFLTLRVV